MEICLPSKRLPRRTTLCLYLVGLVFVAGALYSYTTETRHGTPSFAPMRVESEPQASVHVSRTKFSDSGDYLTASGMAHAASNSTRSIRPSTKDNVREAHETIYVSAGKVPTKYVFAGRSSSGSINTTTMTHHQPKISPSTQSPAVSTCALTYRPRKLILLWTSFFDSWIYIPQGPYGQCPCPNCEVTADRAMLLQSDAVIFHARDMDLADLPPVRLPHQRWIFYCLESPPYSDFPGLSFMHGMFNWTMSYRLDSDIVTTYGAVHKVYPSRKLSMSSLSATWEGKSRSVVWMSSHCPTAGGRDEYVAELRKYIDVDVYGSCGSYNCSQGATHRCMQDFAVKYKFFLAFENSICKDYITEKFFRTLQHDIIPVVFGGARYQRFAPPGSFVDALSFKSPKHLAFFLAGIGSNFGLYSSYFLWRKDHVVKLDSRRECDLCALLHRQDLKPSSYLDLRQWWVHESGCRSWRPKT